MTYADGVVWSLNRYSNDCEDLQISLLRAEYHTATNKTFSANTLCSDQLAALEFHAAAVRVLGVRGGGL